MTIFGLFFFLELTTKEIKRRIALARQKAVVLARIGPGKRVNGKVAKLKLHNILAILLGEVQDSWHLQS